MNAADGEERREQRLHHAQDGHGLLHSEGASGSRGIKIRIYQFPAISQEAEMQNFKPENLLQPKMHEMGHASAKKSKKENLPVRLK